MISVCHNDYIANSLSYSLQIAKNQVCAKSVQIKFWLHFCPCLALGEKNLTFCALLNLTKVLLQDDEVDHKKQKTENGSNGAAAEDEGEEEEDAEEEEDIDGEEEEDVDGEGEEDLDEEEGGEGETLIATLSLPTFAQKAHISIVALHKTQ